MLINGQKNYYDTPNRYKNIKNKTLEDVVRFVDKVKNFTAETGLSIQKN